MLALFVFKLFIILLLSAFFGFGFFNQKNFRASLSYVTVCFSFFHRSVFVVCGFFLRLATAFFPGLFMVFLSFIKVKTNF